MRKTVLAALGVACGLAVAPSFAQNLQMTEAPSAAARAEMPTRGMSMAQVEARYGSPAERYAAVGEPPITCARPPSPDREPGTRTVRV
jgi:hypothetical protein